jgi:WD40 repeat protein/serine/threonine protein kinase
MTDDLTGFSFGKYKLQTPLGRGGMAQVYQAYQENLNRYVAIKVMHSHLSEKVEFVNRFHREAAAVARLRHPNIVTVYDFDIEDGRYYMVMELIEGPTLKTELESRLFEEKPLQLEEIVAIFNGLGQAMDYAHARRIIHRDLKPANIMFTNEGQVVLTDFGIAQMVGRQHITQTDRLVGTPAYMAPEQGIPQNNLDGRSDVYSLGIILYEMITGHVPFNGRTNNETLQLHQEAPLPSPNHYRPDLPPAVTAVIQQALAKEPENRYPRAGRLAQALREAIDTTGQRTYTVAVRTIATPPVILELDTLPGESLAQTSPQACPYRGLFAFREEDADFFHGRETFTERLHQLLHQRAMVAIIGPSGSGKSSVVFAGLVPLLRREQKWGILSFRPGSQPFISLVDSLMPLLTPTTNETDPANSKTQLADDLQNGRIRLYDLINRIIRRNHLEHILLIADQFEEIYTLCQDTPLRRQFLNTILDITDIHEFYNAPRFTFLLTMRSDFMGQALVHRDFADALQDADIKLGPMTRRELGLAISRPARRQGMLFEPGLVARILDDVGDEPGNLPLLEFALTELWHTAENGRLSHAGYQAIGQVEGALATYADRIYNSLTPTEQEQARQIFIQMVRPGEGTEDTRRLATRFELDNNTWPLVQKLADARLVITGRSPTGEQTVELVHEALIRGWNRLRRWMETDRAFRAWQERLRLALTQWYGSNRDDDVLLRGALLAEAEGWQTERAPQLTPAEQQFITASLTHRTQMQAAEAEQRQKQERAILTARYADRLANLMLVLGIAIVLTITFAAIAENNRRQAAINEQRAQLGQATAVAAQQTAEADAALRATAEADTQAQRRIAEQERDSAIAAQSTAIAAQQIAVSAQQTAEADAALRATAVAIAQSSAREANSRELASNSRNQLTSDPQLSLLLAMEAVSITLRQNEDPPPAAEDALYQALQASQLRRTFTGHTNWINDLAYSPDGQTIATASNDTNILLWNATTGQTTGLLGDHARAVNTLAYSPNGALLASGGDDGFIILWDTTTGERITVLGGQDGSVRDLAFHPDSNQLLAAYDGRVIRLWDVGNRRSDLRLTAHAQAPGAVAFSPNGALFASGGNDGRIILWQTATGLLQESLAPLLDSNGQPIHIRSLMFSPDNQRLIAGLANGTAVLLDSQTAATLRTLSGHGSEVNSVAFSPNGQLISTASNDGTVKIWQAETGQALFTITGHTGGVTSAAFHPFAPLIATASQDNTARTWHTVPALTPLILTEHTAPIRSIAFTPDGRYLLSGGSDNTVNIWHVDNGRLHATLPTQAPVTAVAVNPQSTFIAAATQTGAIWLWPTADLKTPTILTHTTPILALAFHPHSPQFATTDSAGQITLWSLSTGSATPLPTTLSSPIRHLTYNPDGTLLAVSLEDGTTAVLDANTGRLQQRLHGHTAPVNAATFSPDGAWLATASSDGSAHLWQLDNTLTNNTPVRTFSGHTGAVFTVHFSPDGSRLLTSGADRTARLWETSSGQVIRTFVGHTAPVTMALFSPDGALLATSSTDNTARIHTLDSAAELLIRAQTQVLRPFTTAECIQYLPQDRCETGGN